MQFYGLQKLSMVDYPGKVAATVFTGGCNLRCPFCHNALLVTRLGESQRIPEEVILSFLASRRGLLDGVVLSGGEPLMQPGVEEFLAAVKSMGYSVKLDTNGCYPATLKRILSAGLVDYVAMDIKNSPQKYALTVGIPDFDITPIQQSITLLRQGQVDYEFRTTIVREFHEERDILEICRWIGGSKAWYLQNFEDSGNLIGSGMHAVEEDTLRSFAEKAKSFFENVCIRGI